MASYQMTRSVSAKMAYGSIIVAAAAWRHGSNMREKSIIEKHSSYNVCNQLISMAKA